MPLMHIVLFKLDEAKATGEAKAKLFEGLKSLEQLPMVTKVTFGANNFGYYEGMENRGRGYDVGYTAVIDKAENLEAYAKSQLHVDVIATVIKPILAAPPLAIDYEF